MSSPAESAAQTGPETYFGVFLRPQNALFLHLKGEILGGVARPRFKMEMLNSVF